MLTPDPDSTPIALEAYEALAERYAARVDTKPHNACYERPATLSLLPDVAGLRVLDAGCGPGAYADWLLQHGAAHVTGLDLSPRMVALAAQRLGERFPGRVTLHQHDLNRPLDFLDSAAFDLVICPLVLDYLATWEAVFAEFHRVLRPGGVFVFSAGHPMGDYLYHQTTARYFETERVAEVWRGFGEPFVTVARYRRPLAATLNPLLAAGFILERLLEPLPTEEFAQADPRDYAELMREPVFLCLRARRGGAAAGV